MASTFLVLKVLSLKINIRDMRFISDLKLRKLYIFRVDLRAKLLDSNTIRINDECSSSTTRSSESILDFRDCYTLTMKLFGLI